MDETATGLRARAIAAIGLVLILGLHAAIILHAISRPLDHDEGEHLRAAEWMAAGKVLYADFVENHTPFLYLILSRFAPTDLDFEGLRRYITSARLLAVVAGTAAAAMVALFASRAAGTRLAFLPVLAVLLSPGWTESRGIMDVRSEPFTLLLFWGGVILIVSGGPEKRKSALLAGVGAALVAVAAIWNPKWPLETAAIAVWYLIRLRSTAQRSWRDAAASLFIAAAGPIVAIVAALRVAPVRALLFFGYRYPMRFYEWFRSSPLVGTTFHFSDPFEYCSPWFRPPLAAAAIVLLIILLLSQWRSIGEQRQRVAMLLIVFVIAGAVELRFLYSYPRLWPQYFVMWGCSLAAAYGVVLSAAPRRYRPIMIGANVVVLALFLANVISELRTPVDQGHWKFKKAVMSSLRPGEAVWMRPQDGPFVASAGSYYWYAYADQVPFSIAYAKTAEARRWLPSITEADLPPCRMLDAYLHGLPEGEAFVRFIDERNVLNLPQSARCLADLERKGFAHRVGGLPVLEIKRPRSATERAGTRPD